MDWACDNAGLNDRDIENVFRYEPKYTTVVRMLTSDKKPVMWSLETEGEWEDWLRKDRPSLEGSDEGLVLILSKRTGEAGFGSVKKVRSDDWLERINAEILVHSRTPTTTTFASLAEKSVVSGSSKGALGSGRRSVRTLPFSQQTFRLITRKFYTHSSIARVISRADVPVFTSAEVQMGEPGGPTYNSYVYSCRTTNAWDMDLALTATYFPHCGLTFAILFGCPISVEEAIIKRLELATSEAAHPLLMTGIFAELERTRHVHVVEATIDELETRIFELDVPSGDMDGIPDAETETRNQEKRSAWLDTTYLRNGLVSWNTQLAKIGRHAEELTETIFQPGHPGIESSREIDPDRELIKEKMRRTGYKIKDRIQDIIDEYDDKIRDCTMRVDGMAMATQWAHSEANVEIARGAGRDSRHMRSIAIVTMVFLPGTFFASVFSMSFFNWSGGPEVSVYFWIYVVLTVSFTLLTLGSWYYFVVYRRTRRLQSVV